MTVLALPSMPSHMRASELIHGSDADFIINAYLALQRNWPDAGGFAHYMYVLSQRPHDRLNVLKEIAISEMARKFGASLEIDLPDGFLFAQSQNEHGKFRRTSMALRVPKAIDDVHQLRQSVSNLTLDGLSKALEAIVQTQQANLAALESRLNEVGQTVRTLQAGQLVPDGASPVSGQPATSASGSADGGAWMRAELQHMAQRLLVLEQQGPALQAIQAMRKDMADLRAAFDQLQHYTMVDLKRHLADYVNALVSALTSAAGLDGGPNPPASSATSPTSPVTRLKPVPRPDTNPKQDSPAKHA